MKVKMDEDELEGLYTGHVSQIVRQRMITIPVQLTYELGKSLQLKAGPYLSLLLSKEFYGYASDGYLRKDDPTGVKVVMGRGGRVYRRPCFPRLVGDEQSRRVGWTIAALMVCPSGEVAETDPGTYEATRYAPCVARLLWHGASRCQTETGPERG